MIDPNVNFLGSCEENQTFNKLSIGRANELMKMLTSKGKSTLTSSQQSLYQTRRYGSVYFGVLVWIIVNGEE